jgi:hypothetical protein
MSIGTIAATSIRVIVDGFMMTPPHTVEDTVGVLKTVMPDMTTSPIIKNQIAGNRKALEAMARLDLNDRYEDIEPEIIEKFNLYFSQVFDTFLAD